RTDALAENLPAAYNAEAFLQEVSAAKAEALLQEVATAYKGASTLSGTLIQERWLAQHLDVTKRTLALQRTDLLSADFLSAQQTENSVGPNAGEVTVWDRSDHAKDAKTSFRMLFREPFSVLVTLFYFPDELPKLDFLKQIMQSLGGAATT